jgi:spore coat protein CotF
MQLNQKETSLLQDLKKQEEVCVEKYGRYSNDANDAQLKSLFGQIGQAEQQHLNTITQILGGTVPQMPSGGGQQAQAGFTQTYTASSADPNKAKDAFLCTDMLSTEKHVSSVYDTSIFEFKDTGIRNDLNHIQKEEQEHGEQLYNYMAANNMYG